MKLKDETIKGLDEFYQKKHVMYTNLFLGSRG